ncbi:16382_t:CDS:2 [Entrophospora sp. SA101]|nr:16382_t:CDS:2 [Entrophospora sp. SA101]CAJ0896836.1 5893_t:CDS:2 [Entrophospora sp. SA101]
MYTISFNSGALKDKFYCLVDDIIVESDREMEGILKRLKNLWMSRQMAQFEGQTYSIGDFVIRAANASNSPQKGMLIEIEYLPTLNYKSAIPLLKEFITILLPDVKTLSWSPGSEMENFKKVGLSETDFSRTHTAHQYIMLFKNNSIL